MLRSRNDAYTLLQSLGASTALLTHLKLVGEAGDALIDVLNEINVPIREEIVRLGIAVHDAGKILHPEELVGPGNLHEAAGQTLMLENDVQFEVARCCVSHSEFESANVSFEELLVALADKLWKGKRVERIEIRVIDQAAALAETDRWALFDRLDSCFEQIAAGGHDRLLRSRAS